MDEDGFGSLGFFVLGVLYFFMGIGSLLSTAAINKFGTKKCLMIGGFGTIFYIFSMTFVGAKDEKVT